MSDISRIDSNFTVRTDVDVKNLVYHDINKEPFKIYGMFYEGDRYRRIPEKLAFSLQNPGVEKLHSNTAGGRVRFTTDSEYIAIKAVMDNIEKMSHCALTGCAGFDMYENTSSHRRYMGTFIPPYDITDGYRSFKHFGERKKRDITINFPLYSDVKEFYIGISEDSCILAGGEYKIAKPVVFYGSSITHGGCASKPGSTYESIVSARLDCDHINLGFSGSARGEEAMAEYIASLDMSAFVLDYDYNAPNVEHLKNTHENFYKIVRKHNPDLPVIMMSIPRYYLNPDMLPRLEVIRQTYANAVKSGDKNVYLIEGTELMDDMVRDNGTVDGTHPTDSGFLSMANVVERLLRKILM